MRLRFGDEGTDRYGRLRRCRRLTLGNGRKASTMHASASRVSVCTYQSIESINRTSQPRESIESIESIEFSVPMLVASAPNRWNRSKPTQMPSQPHIASSHTDDTHAPYTDTPHPFPAKTHPTYTYALSTTQQQANQPMLRRGLGRLAVAARQQQRRQQQQQRGGGGSHIIAAAAAARGGEIAQQHVMLQPARGFRHHEGGWWEVSA